MIKEYKDLLLKDLCARLPYDTKVSYNGNIQTLSTLHIFDLNHIKEEYVDIKPYLRPMSSMTKKEKKDFLPLTIWVENDLIDIIKYPHMYEFTITIKAFDWLNRNKFDFRDLIPKGLAIEVTEENNPYN